MGLSGHRHLRSSVSDAQTARELQHFKSATNVLESLSESISMAPATLQTAMLPIILHHGLASLPPEILVHIRICLKDLDEPCHIEPHRYSFVLNKSFPLVCRQFRNLELSIPSLWTLLKSNMTTDRINLHIARSGALGLKVLLVVISGTGCVCEKWRLLAQSSHRWSILAISVNGQQHNCFSTLRGLSLPSLWNLHISDSDKDVIPVLSTWTIPSVRVVISLAPSTLLALPLTQSLTTLRLNHEYVVFDMDRLLDFLGSAKASQLTNLHVSLHSLNVQGGPKRYKKMILPMLRDLSLQCFVDIQVLEHTVLQSMRCITMPNIRFVTLVLTKDIAMNDTFINWFRSLKNPTLRTVTVRVLGDLDGTSKERIGGAFQGDGGSVFQVESSTDIFGALDVKIDFA